MGLKAPGPASLARHDFRVYESSGPLLGREWIFYRPRMSGTSITGNFPAKSSSEAPGSNLDQTSITAPGHLDHLSDLSQREI